MKSRFPDDSIKGIDSNPEILEFNPKYCSSLSDAFNEANIEKLGGIKIKILESNISLLFPKFESLDNQDENFWRKTRFKSVLFGSKYGKRAQLLFPRAISMRKFMRSGSQYCVSEKCDQKKMLWVFV